MPRGSRGERLDDGMIVHAEGFYFKRHKGLLAYARRYPEGLAAHLLHQIRLKMNAGCASDAGELSVVGPTLEAAQHSEVMDWDDVREIQFLARLMAKVGVGRVPQAFDLAADRARRIRAARLGPGSLTRAASTSAPGGPAPPNAALADGARPL